MEHYERVGFSVLGLAVLVSALSCAPRTERRVAAAPDDPLDAGWRFACSITNDPGDRAECQEKIAMAHLARGECDKALTLGEQIENWRKGVLLAEAAAKLSEGGQTNAALARAAQAEAIGRSIQDWQRDRILSRVAKTKAFLGKEEDVSQQSAFYRSNQDYRGEFAAYHALALARRGEVTNALAVLDGLAGTAHLDVSSWRANGYLLMAKAGYLDRAQTSNALTQAWGAASQVPGPKRWDVQMGLVEEATALDAKELAQTWLEGISSNILTGKIPAHVKASQVVRLAVRWASLGHANHLDECTRAAETLIRELQNIDQPALFAVLGEAWVRMGVNQKGLGYYEHALELAGNLTNSRPRAMACVEICLSLDRVGLRHRPVNEGLNRLLAGFGAAHD